MAERPDITEGHLRIRVSQLETPNLDGLLANAMLARMMTDAGSEIGIRRDGTDGYLAAYENWKFHGSAYAGDYVEVNSILIHQGNRSRRMRAEARLVIRASRDAGNPFGAELLKEPELLAAGEVVSVVPRDLAGLTPNTSLRQVGRHPGGDRGFLRLRIHTLDTHYMGGLLAGASLTRIMADAAAEIVIRRTGRYAQMDGFEKVDILAPVYAGDFIEVSAEIAEERRSELVIEASAARALRTLEQEGGLSGGEAPETPQPVGRARFTVSLA